MTDITHRLKDVEFTLLKELPLEETPSSILPMKEEPLQEGCRSFFNKRDLQDDCEWGRVRKESKGLMDTCRPYLHTSEITYDPDIIKKFIDMTLPYHKEVPHE